MRKKAQKRTLQDRYAEFAPQFVVDAKGQKCMVLLNLAEYQNLIEDLDDLRVLAERKNESEISFDVFEKKLKQNGKL